MGKEVDFSDYPMWILLAALSVPLSVLVAFNMVTVLLFIAGVAVGVIIGFVAAKRELHAIETKGEYKASLKTIAYFAAWILIAALIFIAFSGTAYRIFVAFGPMWASGCCFRSVLSWTCLNWEKKQGKIIMHDGFLGKRQYAIQKTVDTAAKNV
jgi:hypothetical protein